jgi:hypothetical protein
LSFSHPTLKSETQHKIPFFVLTPVFPEWELSAISYVSSIPKVLPWDCILQHSS